MSAQEILHYIITHSEMLMGITIALALVTLIFILVQPNPETKLHSVDLSGIEETLKRVIEKMPQTSSMVQVPAQRTLSIQDEEEVVVAEPVTLKAIPPIDQLIPPATGSFQMSPSTADLADLENLKLTVSEREQKINVLESEIKQLKAKVSSSPESSGNAYDEAMAKIQELQSKLGEYAIIEEELADISKYKEENIRIKSELEKLKSTGVSAAPQPVESKLPNLQELPSDDLVVREFQAAVENQSAPKIAMGSDVAIQVPESPLDGTLDTSKMLEEIEKLGDGDEDEVDPMAGLLDTEKLLAEVRELGGPKNTGSSPPEQTAVDDLMSEFESEQKQPIKAKA